MDSILTTNKLDKYIYIVIIAVAQLVATEGGRKMRHIELWFVVVVLVTSVFSWVTLGWWCQGRFRTHMRVNIADSVAFGWLTTIAMLAFVSAVYLGANFAAGVWGVAYVEPKVAMFSVTAAAVALVVGWQVHKRWSS